MSNALSLVPERLNAILPPLEFYVYAAPILIMLLGAMVVLMAGVFRSDLEKPNFTAFGLAIVSCVAAAAVPLFMPFSQNYAFLGQGFLADGITRFGMLIVSLGTLFTVMVGGFGSRPGVLITRPEMMTLLMFSSTGMMVMLGAGEFMSFFTGLELMSIPLYILVGYQRSDYRGLESAIKYFILGSCAAGLLLMGMAFIYLHTGSMQWVDLKHLQITADAPFAVIGVVLFLSGIVFKLGLFPFHMWVPDIYQGANSVLTGYMSGLVKASVALALLRILTSMQPSPILLSMFWIFGAGSIVIGSTFGLVHNSVKRMLAYSSIANAGYFCLAFATLSIDPNNVTAQQALIAYTAVYAILSLGSFAILSRLEAGNREDLLREDLAGLGQQRPYLAAAFTVFLFGLAGIPPVAGFFGKFLLLNAAVSQGLIGLAVVLVLMSCFSLYYYLAVMVEIWFKPASRSSVIVMEGADEKQMRALIGIAVAAAIIIGLVGPRWALNAHSQWMRSVSSQSSPNSVSANQH